MAIEGDNSRLSISGPICHGRCILALKPANALCVKHSFAGKLLMEAIDREYAARVDNVVQCRDKVRAS